ncbi:MAG: ArsR/SmtB family transcription factor [Bdellovibrionales bacterium]
MAKDKVSIPKIKRSCPALCSILKALSHPQRLMILSHLLHGPRTVSELTELCDCTQSQMSHFLTRMRIEGLVAAERHGKFQEYSLADERLERVLKVLTTEYCG